MAGLISVPLSGRIDPARAFAAFDVGSPGAFWLDGGSTRSSHVGAGTPVTLAYPLRSALKRVIRSAMHDGTSPSAVLGFVGWLGYDFGCETTAVKVGRNRLDETTFLRVDNAVSIAPDGSARILIRDNGDAGHVASSVRAVLRLLKQQSDSLPPRRVHGKQLPLIRWHDSDREYLEKISACQAFIRAGDVYQVCLTTRVSMDTQLDPLHTYLKLRRTNGTSRSSLIRVLDTWVLSTSPEQFVTVGSDRHIRTSPIKGTRPRSDCAEDDERLRRDLLSSTKERAENVMIVDLMRNDLSRVSELGTVKVTRLLETETYAQVHQLVSTIEARLRPEVDIVDVLSSCFPGGSMTGAPKARAMEIIEELECGPRGLYSGAIGYIGFDGTADFTMTIRTLVYRDGLATIGTGGGITIDSNPEEELAEVKLKARALLDAVTAVDGESRYVPKLMKNTLAHA